MDERMINLFSLIAEYARERNDLFECEEAIIQALLNRGYRLDEADAALSLMQNLAEERLDAITDEKNRVLYMRTMNREERSRFSTDAFGFLSRLVRLGVISEDQREEIIEKAMVIYSGRIDIQDIKAIIASILYIGGNNNQAVRASTWN